ncbi:MAG: hypothetical protein AAF928_06540 [Myxococcota bacterium]
MLSALVFAAATPSPDVASTPPEVTPPPYRVQPDEPPADPRVHPTATWLALQVLPSPSLAIGPGPERFGLGWQVTPVLYSFALRDGFLPWRFFAAEPSVRHGGSIEAYASPELYFGASTTPLFRAGLRAYLPVLSRGELLSLAVGSSVQHAAGATDVAYEAGAYLLFGILGLSVSHAPGAAVAPTVVSIRVRYF